MQHLIRNKISMAVSSDDAVVNIIRIGTEGTVVWFASLVFVLFFFSFLFLFGSSSFTCSWNTKNRCSYSHRKYKDVEHKNLIDREKSRSHTKTSTQCVFGRCVCVRFYEIPAYKCYNLFVVVVVDGGFVVFNIVVIDC